VQHRSGVQVLLVGHSERRHVIGETDILINQKVRAALDAGFEVILCVGEKLGQREAGQTDAIISAQADAALAGIAPEMLGDVMFAYEPVWAIGTGKTCSPDEANRICKLVRDRVAAKYGQPAADRFRVLYGGSVKPDNVQALMEEPNVDGGLVGGASLDAKEFLAIAAA